MVSHYSSMMYTSLTASFSQGALVYDPCIGQFAYVQEEVPAVPYVVENNNLFNFNESFLERLGELHHSCGYAEYIEKYLQFPPVGNQPPCMNFNQSKLQHIDLH
jgi:carboxypeptidase D